MKLKEVVSSDWLPVCASRACSCTVSVCIIAWIALGVRGVSDEGLVTAGAAGGVEGAGDEEIYVPPPPPTSTVTPPPPEELLTVRETGEELAVLP